MSAIDVAPGAPIARPIEALPHETTGAPPDGLIAGRGEILDEDALDAALEAAARAEGGDAQRRAAAVVALRGALDAGRARIERAFRLERRSGQLVARSIAWLTDRIVDAAFAFVTERLTPLSNPTTAERVAVVAVGGYGRGEMAPFSDVDLLFLRPYKANAWVESVVEAMLYILWDLKIKVGHATRTVDECLRLAQGDVTIRTSLLEHRFICGSPDMVVELDRRLWEELFSRTGPEFVEAKLAERDRRHARLGGSRYLLEPNLKESKGGLRDMHTLLWIAKYLYRANSLNDLVRKGVFSCEEAVRFRDAEAHLWTVRCGLHYVAGRAQDKLTFDLQVELAEAFRYRERPGQRAVERFMRRYFISAKAVGDLTRIFCAALEHQHKKSPPLLGGLVRLFSSQNGRLTEPGLEWMEQRDGRLMIGDASALEEEPLRMFELIETAIRSDIFIHPSALRLMHRHRRLTDERFRARPEAAAAFLRMIAASKDPARALRRLNETDVLARFLPDFGRVVALMQFNLYHHYTVDEHTILALDLLQKLADGTLADEHPIETEIVKALPNRRVLATALLLHDVGKGVAGDHSVTGEEIARRVGAELNMTRSEIDQIAWLVRHHLVMSDVAQRRDISDPATVRDFARIVRSPARLKLLYVLTVCDIRAVGPGRWNGWKAQLLRQLYHEARSVLTDEAAGMTLPDRIAASQAALRARVPDWSEAAWAEHINRFYPTYWLGLSTDSQALHVDVMAETEDAPLRMRVAPSPDRDATEVVLYTSDHPGLFARMAGAFALAGASVVDARAYTTKDGMAVNTFWVQDPEDEAYDDPHRLERLRAEIAKSLNGEVVAREALKARRRLKKREQSFDVPSSVTIDNAASDVFTVIEVSGRDRVGLLYDLARTLAAENVSIFSAIIATYGEHAVDVFYVKDLFGMKISQPRKQRRIEEALLEALDRAAGAAVA